VKKLVVKNRGITTCNVINKLGISFGSLQRILKESEYTSDCHQISALPAQQGAEGQSCQHIPDIQERLEGHPEFILEINAGDRTQQDFK
jgi:hypothetical protein